MPCSPVAVIATALFPVGGGSVALPCRAAARLPGGTSAPLSPIRARRTCFRGRLGSPTTSAKAPGFLDERGGAADDDAVAGSRIAAARLRFMRSGIWSEARNETQSPRLALAIPGNRHVRGDRRKADVFDFKASGRARDGQPRITGPSRLAQASISRPCSRWRSRRRRVAGRARHCCCTRRRQREAARRAGRAAWSYMKWST